MLTRRALLTGLVAAPAIVRYASLMPVKLFEPEPSLFYHGGVTWTEDLLNEVVTKLCNPPLVFSIDGTYRTLDQPHLEKALEALIAHRPN